jgi:hypothetical protein
VQNRGSRKRFEEKVARAPKPQVYAKVIPQDIKEWWLKPMQLDHKTTMGTASDDPRRPKTTPVLPPLTRSVRAPLPVCAPKQSSLVVTHRRPIPLVEVR